MSLIGLNTRIENVTGIGPKFLPKFKKLGLKTVRDLLWHFPYRYEDWSEIADIGELLRRPASAEAMARQEQKTIQGVIKKIETRRSWQRRMTITEIVIEDGTGEIRAIWFNQPYIGKILKVGARANFAGKISKGRDGKLFLSNPVHELIGKSETKHTARLVPIYPETKGLTSKGIRFILKSVFENLEPLEEFIPKSILEKFEIPEINEALRWIHFPADMMEAEKAKNRFAFEEIFLLQLRNLRQKISQSKEKATKIESNIDSVQEILESLPFELTKSQKESLWEILKDISKPHPMNRLLQGDVGSGKTIVVGIASILAATQVQIAIMAPTEILARQHYNTFVKFFSGFGGGIGLLISKEAKVFYGDTLETKVNKDALTKDVASGKIKILIGTHSLIQKGVKFNNLGLVIVDEQHRFGVAQRAELLRTQTNADYTQTNAEEPKNSTNELLFKEITYKIRGAAFEVKKQLGLGHKESIYQKALAKEFDKRGLPFSQEESIAINYEDKKVGSYRPDFIIEDKILVELKALPFIGTLQEKQIWSYLKGSKYKLAMLINFGGADIEIKRVVYDTKRSPRESASNQRQSAIPHFLSMSATPIPRTLMITIFGDLDLSILTELPKGRKEIVTKAVDPENRMKAYAFIRGQVRKGDQVFIVCPRIESQIDADKEPQMNADRNTSASNTIRVNLRLDPRESAALDTKAVKEEYARLSKKIFPDLKVAMLHGKLKSAEKDKVMRDFGEKKYDILVSTSVIEVGIDIPNATIIIIEGAERFGLAQLYQFRGRVGRGEKRSFCLLFTESKSDKTKGRLESLINAKNGFELAEYDLKLRGPGEFLGATGNIRQTGIPDIAMSSLQNPQLIKNTRDSAEKILNEDPELKNYPKLKERLSKFQEKIHLE